MRRWLWHEWRYPTFQLDSLHEYGIVLKEGQGLGWMTIGTEQWYMSMVVRTGTQWTSRHGMIGYDIEKRTNANAGMHLGVRLHPSLLTSLFPFFPLGGWMGFTNSVALRCYEFAAFVFGTSYTIWFCFLSCIGCWLLALFSFSYQIGNPAWSTWTMLV